MYCVFIRHCIVVAGLGVSPSIVQAVEMTPREMTTPEAISLTSALEGFDSVFLGLQDQFGIDLDAVSNWNVNFTSSAAILTSEGTFKGSDLILEYSGSLSQGVYGNGNLEWTGNWDVSLGTDTFKVTDTATWIFDPENKTYVNMNFAQDAQLTQCMICFAEGTQRIPKWLIRTAEVLGGIAVGVGTGSVSGGWAGLGAAIGATSGLLSISNVVINNSNPPVTPTLPTTVPLPLPVPNPNMETITITGNNNNVNKQSTNSTGQSTLIQGSYACSMTMTCRTSGTVTTIPEPLTILGAGTAAGFGAFFKRELNKKKKVQKDSEES